jgi:mono/diheme cytochrome c family protein
MNTESQANLRIRLPRSDRLRVPSIGVLAAALGLAPACAANGGDGEATDTSADTITTSATCRAPAGCIRADRIEIVGATQYGSSTGQIPYSSPPKYRALKFSGVAGDSVDIVVRSPDGDAYAWLLDSEFGILAFNNDAPAGKTTDSRITMALPSTGSLKYFIAFRTRTSTPATFDVTLNGPPNLSYASTRIQQTDIDNGVYSADQLFAFADVMFEHTFTIDDGLGNALLPPLAGPNPRPNARRIHNGKFGGPDATNCIGCHNVGGQDGGGTLDNNLLQDGDGVNLSSALVRNPPAILGDGYVQELGIEMTADLQAQLAAAKSGAAGAQGPTTVALASKGVSFGSAVVGTDGTVDFGSLQGVDADLVVKPLGWKGRTAVLRRFVEGGFQVHFGMASQALIAQNCKAPIPNVVGNGQDCTDPDDDGVRDEILEGQLTSMALYPTLLQVPIRINPTDPTALQRVGNGEALFASVGCTSCHVQSLTLNNPVHHEKPDLSGGAPFVTDLTVDGRLPRLSPQGDGTVIVELWSDLKRHDMGDSLADAHDTFGHAVPARLFMTRPLWGVAVTPPYLHDGRAATLGDAIAQHDGEAAPVRDAYLALDTDAQAEIVEFLQTLSRDPRHTDD